MSLVINGYCHALKGPHFANLYEAPREEAVSSLFDKYHEESKKEEKQRIKSEAEEKSVQRQESPLKRELKVKGISNITLLIICDF